jgi:hypothetical protein
MQPEVFVLLQTPDDPEVPPEELAAEVLMVTPPVLPVPP